MIREIDLNLLRVHLQLPQVCNMDPPCPYCSTRDRRNGRALTVPQAQDWWLGLARLAKGRPLHVVCLEGEPTADGGLMVLLRRLGETERVELISNLVDLDPLRGFPLEGAPSMAASYHAHYWQNPAAFALRLRNVREIGWRVYAVFMVPHPSRFKTALDEANELRALGETVALMPFGGMWQGRLYPEGYTNDQKAVLQANMLDCWGTTRWWPTKGRMCLAGSRYLCLAPDGTARACYQEGAEKLGNVFAGDVRLRDEAKPCPFPTCPCPDMQSYIVEDRHANEELGNPTRHDRRGEGGRADTAG